MNSGRRDLLLALAATTLLFALVHGAQVTAPYVVNDDVRQQLFWMQAWQEPGLYADDLLTEYAKRYVTWGVTGLYWLAAPLLDPLTFSKVLTGLEFVALGGLLFLVGRSLAGRSGAWGTLCAYWLMPFFLYTMSGGLARSFGAPLMALFWLAWLRGGDPDPGAQRLGRWGLLAALLLLGLFLPYIYALCALALGLGFVLGRLRLLQSPPMPKVWWEYALVALSALPVLLYTLELSRAGFGPMVTTAEMAGDPAFGPLGRFQILPVPSLFFELVARPWERILPFRELTPVGGVLVGLLLGVVAVVGARRMAWRPLLPRLQGAACILAASLLLWVVARVLLLALFIPSRYLEYTTNLFYCVLLGLLVGAAFRNWTRRPVLAVGLVLLALGGGALRLDGEGLYDYSEDAALTLAVRRTEPSALFAGHPYTMDNVLTFGRRKVLAAYELAHPWSRGYWEQARPAFEAMLTAYYAKDPELVRKFCQTYKVDYLIVDERHFGRAFTESQRQLVPVCQAPMPEQVHSLCRALGLRFPVLVRHGERLGFPGDHPMFAPYGERIRAQAARPGAFALLDESLFPGEPIAPHYRLIPMTGHLSWSGSGAAPTEERQ